MLKPIRYIKPVTTKIIPNLGIPDRTHANPGLLRWKDHWLFVSCAGLAWDARLIASRLNDDLEVMNAEVLTTTKHELPNSVGAEDARLFIIGDTVYLTYNVAFGPTKDWASRSSRIVLCEFDPDNLRIISEELLDHPALKSYEKNWIFFENKGFVNFIYQIHMSTILGMVYKGRIRFSPNPYPFLDWHHGYPRGSTPTVRVGDEYYTLLHSHCIETDMRHYVAGMFTFKLNPFRLCRKTGILLYPPKDNEGLGPVLYRVVFPCGLALHENTWYVSYGVNDYECRISTFNFQEIENELRPI